MPVGTYVGETGSGMIRLSKTLDHEPAPAGFPHRSMDTAVTNQATGAPADC